MVFLILFLRILALCNFVPKVTSGNDIKKLISTRQGDLEGNVVTLKINRFVYLDGTLTRSKNANLTYLLKEFDVILI